MKFRKIKLSTFLIYIYVFSVIYQSGSVRAAVLGNGLLFEMTRMLNFAVPIFCFLVYRKKHKHAWFVLIGMLTGCVPIIINYVLYPEGVMRLTYKIVILLLSALVFMVLSEKGVDIRNKIYDVIIVISTISLIFYFLVEIIKIPMPYSILCNGASYRYRNYFELFFTYHYDISFPRLSGLFWEPGVYQIYLNLALFQYVFDGKDNKIQLVILILSIFFAQSTSGYCVCICLMAIYIIKNVRFTRESKWYFAIIGGVCVMILASYIIAMKAAATSGTDGSYTLRMSDISNGLSIFVQNPILGVGFGNENLFIANDTFGRGSSNGLISYMYMTGIVGMLFVLTPFIINIKKSNDKIKQLVWVALFILFNITEPIYDLPIAAFCVGIEYAVAYKYER